MKIILFLISTFNFLFSYDYYFSSAGEHICYFNDNPIKFNPSKGTNYVISECNNKSFTVYKDSYYAQIDGCGLKSSIDSQYVNCKNIKSAYAQIKTDTCSNNNDTCNAFAVGSSEYQECVQSCIDNLDRLLNEQIEQAIFLDDDFKCKDTFYKVSDSGDFNVYNCDPNTGEEKLIPNAILDDEGGVKCPQGQFTSNLPHLVIGGGTSWNEYSCHDMNQTQELNGNLLHTQFSDEGEFLNQYYEKDGLHYIINNDGGVLEGKIFDAEGNLIGNYNVSSDIEGNLQFDENGEIKPIEDFYSKVPSG
ncbi:hypothetical protein ACN5PB_07840, partial [Aliarcobacter butzleri]